MQEWIDEKVNKEMVRLFDCKSYDIPRALKNDVSISLERLIKLTIEKLKEKENA